MNYRSSIFILIAVIESMLLLPTTITYLGGMLIALLGAFTANNDGTVNLGFLRFAGVLILPGYALFSLWWLVLKFSKLTLSQVPVFIYAGLIIGTIISLFFISPLMHAPPTPHITSSDSFIVIFEFGVGPLIVLSTIVLIMWLRKK